MDFYYAAAKPSDRLPPTNWNRLTNNISREPAPKVLHIRTDEPTSNLLHTFPIDSGTQSCNIVLC